MAAVKRNPPSLSRRDRAQQTRLRMIRAAHEQFVARGYTGATMADIAAAAGVAVQTVYFTFHTKAELLQACYDRAVLGEDDPLPPPQQPWYRAMLAARSGSAALRHFVAGNTEIVARVGALDDIVRSALHEPDAVRVRGHSEELRRIGYRNLVDHLADRFGLASGVDRDTATDLLLMYGATSSYRTLVLDYGWTRERYEKWLHAALVQQLLRRS
ncbi:MAG TPA: TetR family transcriptional regulator [Mycobacteriales bacterium]|nr:TetR family transcriptional regulator [Mycobacteriales bacterium]